MTVASGTAWLLDGDENPLAPPSVVAALQQISPRLGLQYHVAMRAFMVTMQWPEHDPRRQMIRDGHMHASADFEILCPIPAHVSLDEVTGWLEAQLVRVSQNREDVRQMIAAHEAVIAKQNAGVAEAKAADAHAELVENIVKPSSVGARRTRVK